MGVQSANIDIKNQLNDIVADAAAKIATASSEAYINNSALEDSNNMLDLDIVEDTNTENVDDLDSDMITQDDLNDLIGSMTEEEYEQYISGVEAYYNYQIDIVDELLNSSDGYKNTLAALNNYISWYQDNIGMAGMEDVEQMYLDGLAEYGVTDIISAQALQQSLQATVSEHEAAIKMLKNQRDSARYDYMCFLKDYNDYEMNVGEISQETFDTDSNVTEVADYVADPNILSAYSGGTYSTTKIYNYEEFHKKHPEINPMEYMTMVPEGAMVFGIDNYEQLRTLASVYEMNPNYAKVYSYLYDQDPEKAKEYLKANEYEFNNIQGQLEALKFKESLAGADDATIAAAIENEFGVSLEGLQDGVIMFGEGVWHTGEAAYTGAQELATAVGLYNGEIYENRVMSVQEYKRMYILQLLLSKEDKIKAGILTADGKNANPNCLIDFSEEYAGEFLSNNYEISQGIGNMLPSIALSAVNPMAGSVALGVSAGGNAYHGAMVEGHDYLSALGYGVFIGSSEAITQRFLGGLPGLSDVQVTGLNTYLQSMGKEASQEMIQGLFDEIYQCSFMGKELPSTPEEWEAFAKDLGKQGFYGAITAGIMQVPSLGVSRYHVHDYKKYMNSNNVTSEEQEAAIAALKQLNPQLNDLTTDEIIINHGEQLIEIVNLKNNNNIDMNTAIETYNLITLLGSVKEGTTDIAEFNKTIKEKVEKGIISKDEVHLIFEEMVGEKLASWSPNAETSYTLLTNLLDSCEQAEVSYEQLGKSLDLMEAMEGYYDDARKLDLQTGGKIFETYRTHGIVHIFDVLTQSINSYSAMKGAGSSMENVGFKDLDIDTIMLSAIMHDTGMSGGKQIHLDVVDGEIKVTIEDVQSNGDSVRESHSFNSGVNIINEAAALKELGYEDEQIAKAALIAFAHSKSNSGLNPLADNESGWSFAIQALQEATQGADFNIVEELIKAGIILDEGATQENDNIIEVKCPKTYEETNGIIEVDEDGTPIKDGNGGKIKGKIKKYTFDQDKLDELIYSALAVRIGDSLTNNDNARLNQYYGVVTFESMNYSNQSTPIEVLQALEGLFENELSKEKPKILAMPTEESVISALIKIDDGLQTAGFMETQHSTIDSSVTYEVDGNIRNDSQSFVLGENNQTYKVQTNSSGVIDIVVDVKDSNAIPYCTLFAIQERAGELLSLSEKANDLGINLVIKIDSSTKPEIEKLYKQYEEYYKDNLVMKVILEYK